MTWHLNDSLFGYKIWFLSYFLWIFWMYYFTVFSLVLMLFISHYFASLFNIFSLIVIYLSVYVVLLSYWLLDLTYECWVLSLLNSENFYFMSFIKFPSFLFSLMSSYVKPVICMLNFLILSFMSVHFSLTLPTFYIVLLSSSEYNLPIH